MRRAVVSLDLEMREWLAGQARSEHVSQAEVVRRALRLYREKVETQALYSFENLVWLTSGLRRGEEAVAVQQSLRGEWVEPVHEERHGKEK